MLYWHFYSFTGFQIKNKQHILVNSFKKIDQNNESFTKKLATLFSEQLLEQDSDYNTTKINNTIENKFLIIKASFNRAKFSYWNSVSFIQFINIYSSIERVNLFFNFKFYLKKIQKKSNTVLHIKIFWFFQNRRNLVALDHQSSKKRYRVIEYIKLKKIQKINYLKKMLLIRPLISVSRKATKNLSNFWNLPIFPDRSNLQLKYKRNRVRYQLLPTLKVFFNPKLDRVLLSFIEITNKENCYFDFLTTKIIQKKILYEQGSYSNLFLN